MDIIKNHIYLADLNPQKGTEPGKIRPVLVVQTDMINGIHSSTIVLPLTTKIVKEATILRVAVPNKLLKYESNILIDQIRAIDNSRILKHLCELDNETIRTVQENLRILLFE